MNMEEGFKALMHKEVDMEYPNNITINVDMGDADRKNMTINIDMRDADKKNMIIARCPECGAEAYSWEGSFLCGNCSDLKEMKLVLLEKIAEVPLDIIIGMLSDLKDVYK